ncbi:hypothetical protein GCM10022224_007810 [Nonomuraea antimicrobica]|uniref:Uncharacterized protein n=1 Tax=Nonomuraea antimicrobica TaxID=561173 RepID=A0ABP7B440_9ACTN
MNLRQKAGLVLAASTAVITLSTTTPAAAATVTPSAHVNVMVVQEASASQKFSCSKVKNWKARLACHAVMKAGGGWVFSKLENAAKKGWNRYSEAFNQLPRTIRALLWNHKRYFYCLLSPWC